MIDFKRPAATERAQRAQSKKDWYRIEAKAGETTADIFIYDEIGMWGVTSGDFVRDLAKVEATELTLHLNSPGGEVFDGLAIYQAIKTSKANVTVMIDGLAASIASVIAMAGDRVVMAPKAQFMIHDAFTMGVGNAGELRETADLLDRISDSIASVYGEKSGQPADFWRTQMAKDTWYSADEALAAGLIDEVEGKTVEKPAESLGLAASTFKHASRDDAPAPAIKPEPVGAKHSLVKEAPETPAPEVKDERPTFVWDFEAFKTALKEGMNG